MGSALFAECTSGSERDTRTLSAYDAQKTSKRECAMRKLIMVLAALACVAAGPALGDEVFNCADTAAQGFVWENGKSRPTTFKLARYIVRVISETRREVTQLAGNEEIDVLTCFKPFPFVASFYSCRNSDGIEPWVFDGNWYMRAYLYGPPLFSDFAFIAYGTCTKL